MFDVIVIGGGPAGVTAALRARELGASVALVERDHLGGTCTNDGCVPTRVLAKAARLLRNAEQFDAYGLVGERPVVDLAKLMSRTQEIVYKIHEKKQLVQHLNNSGVTVYIGAGEARFVDAHTITLDGDQQLQAEKFIICAGGHARRLNFPGSEYALTHSDVWSLRRLPRSVLIIGGAATGCQLASIFAAFGTSTTVFELGPRLLALEDETVAQSIQQAFEKRGIEIINGFGGVERIEKLDQSLELHYKMGQEIHIRQAEAIVLAVGWPGNVDSLNLAAANVEVQRGYVLVDDVFRTSTGNIFAAGDITGRMMLVQSAGFEARTAAENAVLGPGQPYRHQLVPHGSFTDPEYASVGMTEAQARAVQECAVAVVPYSNIDRAVIDGHTEGFCKLIVSTDTHRILGAHVVGEQAVEIVHFVAAGMAADIWLEQLAEIEIAYPTYTAIVGLAARRLVRDLGVMPLSPEWRTLDRPHAAEWERSENL